HVDGDFLAPADAADSPRLQCAQQPRLRLGRHVADLVEEQRAAVGLLELADRPADRAGERALLVPEQLALDQLAGNCRGVDGNEGPVLARAELVDRFRDELLAGARFTEDQYREV